MTDFKDQVGQTKEKLAGELKEAAGKISGNEQLELKGRIQSAKADIRKKSNVKRNVNKKVEDVKESIAGKINDMIDKNEKTRKK